MKTKQDYIKALLIYHKRYYYELTIDKLKVAMLREGICLKCGEKSRRWSSFDGHFPCLECGFKMTPKQIEKFIDKVENI